MPHLIKEYFYCKYILLFYKNNFKFNQNNYHLIEGKFLDKVNNKEINFGFFKIDEIDFKNKIIYERKKSLKNEKGSEFQLLYYLYLTKNIFHNFHGILETYDRKYIKKIYLDDEKELKLLEIIHDIEKIYKNIENNFLPEKIIDNKCKECSYSDYCLI